MAGKDQYSTNLGLSLLSEVDQSKYPSIYLECARIRNALKVLQGALDQYTGALAEDSSARSSVAASISVRTQNISRFYVYATVDLVIGNVVNLFDRGSAITGARLASCNSASTYAQAICSIAATAGNYAEVILLGILPSYTGLTPGQRYWLSTTGNLQASAPSTAGQIVQPCAYAVTSTDLYFNPTLHFTQL